MGRDGGREGWGWRGMDGGGISFLNVIKTRHKFIYTFEHTTASITLLKCKPPHSLIGQGFYDVIGRNIKSSGIRIFAATPLIAFILASNQQVLFTKQTMESRGPCFKIDMYAET